LLDEVGKWRAYYASQAAAARTNATPVSPDYSAPEPDVRPTPVQPAQPVATAPVITNPGRPAAWRPTAALPRTHVVVTGETAMGITRKFGVKFGALQAANPGVNLGRIHAGQILNLPSP